MQAYLDPLWRLLTTDGPSRVTTKNHRMYWFLFGSIILRVHKQKLISNVGLRMISEECFWRLFLLQGNAVKMLLAILFRYSYMVNSRWKHVNTDSSRVKQGSFMYASRHPLWMHCYFQHPQQPLQNICRKKYVRNENHAVQNNGANVCAWIACFVCSGRKTRSWRACWIARVVLRVVVLFWLDKQMNLLGVRTVLHGFVVH